MQTPEITREPAYYGALALPQDADTFIAKVQADMQEALIQFDRGLPQNPKVRLRTYGDNRIVLDVSTSQAWPSGLTLTKLNRAIAIMVPDTTVVQSLSPTGTFRAVADVTLAQKGDKVVVWTQPAPATLKAQRADDDVLSSALIQLG